MRGGVAGGSLQSVGRQLVKGVVLIHQTCSPASDQSMEDLSQNLSYVEGLHIGLRLSETKSNMLHSVSATTTTIFFFIRITLS